MAELEIGQQVPDFSALTDQGSLRRQDLVGKWAVIHFYPRDNTLGCTPDFCDLYGLFQQLDCRVVGISEDTMFSLEIFARTRLIPFPLVSDETSEACNAFGTPKRKDGKVHPDVIRSTFVLDPQGVLRARWQRVRIPGHVERVLEKLRQLQRADWNKAKRANLDPEWEELPAKTRKVLRRLMHPEEEYQTQRQNLNHAFGAPQTEEGLDERLTLMMEVARKFSPKDKRAQDARYQRFLMDDIVWRTLSGGKIVPS